MHFLPKCNYVNVKEKSYTKCTEDANKWRAILRAIMERSVEKIPELSVDVTGVVTRLERTEKRRIWEKEQQDMGIDGVK